jgi:hypothetical protein
MKTLTLTAAAAFIAAALQSGGASAQAPPDQKDADIPPGLLATIKGDFKDWDFPELPEQSKEDVFYPEPFDLKGAQKAWLVGNFGCSGANNNGMLLYNRAGKGWRRIFEGDGQSLTV